MENIKLLFENIIERYESRKVFFNDHRTELEASNFIMLKGACITTPIVFLVIYFITPFFLPNWHASLYHYLFIPFCVLMAVYYFLNRHRSEPKGRYTNALCVVFELMLFIPCILLDTMANATSAQFFPLLLVALPALFFLPYYWHIIILSAMEILFLVLTFGVKHRFFATTDMVLSAFAIVFSLGVMNLMNSLRVKTYQLSDHYREMSQKDVLSSICNKSYFFELSHKYLDISNPNTSCILIFMDVDDFKSINDTRGHETGDRILASIGDILMSCFRNNDIIGRYGGDEFIVLMKMNGYIKEAFVKNKLINLRDRLRRGLKEAYDMDINISMGAVYANREDIKLTAMLRMADAAMYEAKKHKDTYYRIYPYKDPGGGKRHA